MTSYSTITIGDEHIDVFKAPVEGKPHLAAKVIYSAGGVSYVTADGKMFSTRISYGKWFVGKRWGRLLSVVKDAIALGVVTDKKGALARVVAAEEARRVRADERYAAREILHRAGKVGLRLTPTQIKTLRRKARAV